MLTDIQKKAVLENAKNIIIIGLSPDAQKPSFQVASYLLAKGYTIIPVYPRGGEILGQKAFCSLKDALISLAQKNEQCDIIDVFRKSEALPAVLSEICALSHLSSFDKNRLCVWVQLGLKSQEAYQKAQECGILYQEDSCIEIEHQRLFAS